MKFDSDIIWAVTVPLALAAVFVSLFAVAVPSWNAAATEQKKEDTVRIEQCAENGGNWVYPAQCILGASER